MSENLFLKIISREIPADIVYENDDVLAFRDVNPQAPLHVLIIPKLHIRTINEMQPQNAELFGKLFLAAQEIAAQQGIAEVSYFWLPRKSRHNKVSQKMVTGWL